MLNLVRKYSIYLVIAALLCGSFLFLTTTLAAETANIQAATAKNESAIRNYEEMLSEYKSKTTAKYASAKETVVIDLATEVKPEEPVCPIGEGYLFSDYDSAYAANVYKDYDIPYEFYVAILPESFHQLAQALVALENEKGISSVFLMSVAITEVGWHQEFVGVNNWFNWTTDARTYQDFSSLQDCVDYTGNRFCQAFFNTDFYEQFGGTEYLTTDGFNIKAINYHYARNTNGEVNWAWSELVGELMFTLDSEYQMWKAEVHDLP